LKDKNDLLTIDGIQFGSRLIMGTSLFPNQKILNQSLEISETEIVTVAMRKINLRRDNDIVTELNNQYRFLPNTAGCFTKKEAILTAELARECMQTDWLKLELISDEETLLPDPVELFDTSKELIKKKFKVFAYCSDDPILCKRLEDVGCEAVMPLASPIGSGLGIRNVHNLEIIRKMCKGTVIVDAGIGKPSDAALAMELGCDAVLLNSSVARSFNPPEMANAMRLAVQSGRIGFQSGMIEKNKKAFNSTTFKGKISNF